MIINFFKKKIDFYYPKKNKILIYDDVNAHVLECFFKNYSKLDVRKKYFHFLLLLKTFIKSGFKNFYFEYQVAVIKYINPKLVITFVDNSLYFLLLKKKINNHNMKFIIIQNGLRIAGDIFDRDEKFLKKNIKKLSVDYMFLFGKPDKEKYKKFVKGKIIEHGSLRSNLNIKVNSNKINNNLRSLTFISDYSFPILGRKSIKIFSENKKISWEDFYSCEKIIIPFLINFCKKYNYTLEIALRLKKNAYYEKKFYTDIAKKYNFKLIFKNNSESKNNYRRIDNANCVLFISSTLGYEALARGSKVFAFGIRSLKWKSNLNSFGWPLKVSKNGNFWSNEINEAFWETKILEISKTNQNDWFNKNNKFINNIIKNDKGNKKLKQLLNKIV